MKHDLVTVLDLGSTKATCLAVDADPSGEIEIRAIATVPSRGMRRGVLSDIDEASRSIDAAVRQIQQELDREVSSLVVAISGAHLDGVSSQGLRPIVPRGRHITHQDVLEVVNHSRQLMLPPDREQIQALPQEFRVDGVRDVRRPVGMTGTKLEVVTYVVTGQSSAIQNLERAVEMAGKKVEQMVVAPLGAGIGVLTQDEMELGTVVVDIGSGTTDLAIFTNGSIAHCASLPIGSWHITNDVSKLLKTSPEEADRLKIASGHAVAHLVPERDSVEVHQLGQPVARPMQRRVLCEIIEARVREIAVMVKQQIEKSGLIAVLPGGVVLTGGGAHLDGVDKLFEEVLKHLRVRIAVPELPDKFGAQPGIATALGTARFAAQCYEEFAPATSSGWKDRVKSLFSFGRV